MMPFLIGSIVDMVQKLMKIVVVKDVVDSAKSPVGLLKIDLHNRSSHLPDSSLKLPTGTLYVQAVINQINCQIYFQKGV